MFTHHIHRSELNFLTKQSDGNLKLPTPDVYAKQDVDKFYLKKPTNLDSFNFKYEYFLFQCLESQKKARQSND